MDQFIGYTDLEEKRIFNSRMSLKRAIDDLGFPPGRLITANRRVWTEAEVKAWVDSRPVAPRSERRKRAASADAEAA